MTVNSQLEQSDPLYGALVREGSHQLNALLSASGLGSQAEQAQQLFNRLLEASNWKQAGASVGDCLAPFEFSVTYGASPQVEFVVALAAGDSAESSGLRTLLASLAQNHKLDPKRFEAISELYFPEGRRPTFAARLAVSFAAQRAPRFSLFLDPTVSGLTRAPLCVERTLVRFGFTAAWPVIGQRLTRRGPDTDALKYVCIDLSSPTPRVEVYARHERCNAEDLEIVAAGSPAHRAGDVATFLAALDIPARRFDGLPLLSCYEFSSRTGARPDSVRVEFPSCGYLTTERQIERSVLAAMSALGVTGSDYSTALSALAKNVRPEGLGVQTHVAFQRDVSGAPSMRVRFPMRAAAVTIANPSNGLPASGVMEVVDRYEQWDQITNHPFLHRLRSEPVNLHHIWNILANFQGSISKTFSQRLALIASRVDDPETRFIVTDLLYDEMGSGDYSLAHVNLFSNMMKVMEPWKPALVDDWIMGPAQRFNRSMDQTYGNPDINVALGAIISGEIFGKQFDQFLGDEIRRQNEVDPSLFVWVTLHESLEVTHAGEGADIARLVPPEGLEAMARGAYGLSLGAWGFLTDVYEICYSERPKA